MLSVSEWHSGSSSPPPSLRTTETNGEPSSQQNEGPRNVRFASPQRGDHSETGTSSDNEANDHDSTLAGRNADEHTAAKPNASRAWRTRPELSLTLENSGSVARDHLASERTFLAYVRTSLAIASAGVALVQLFTISATSSSGRGAPINSHLQRFARPLGACVVVMGVFVLLVGSSRYFRIQTALISGHFPPARHTVTFMSAVLAVLVAVVFGILVAVPRR